MKTFRNFAYATGLLMMVPVPGPAPSPVTLDTGKLIGAASERFSDVGYFCERQRSICEAAANVALRVDMNARRNLSVIYSWATDTVEYKMLAAPPDLAVMAMVKVAPSR